MSSSAKEELAKMYKEAFPDDPIHDYWEKERRKTLGEPNKETDIKPVTSEAAKKSINDTTSIANDVERFKNEWYGGNNKNVQRSLIIKFPQSTRTIGRFNKLTFVDNQGSFIYTENNIHNYQSQYYFGIDKGYAVPEVIMACDIILCFHDYSIDYFEPPAIINLKECDLYYRNINETPTDVYGFIPIRNENKINQDDITDKIKDDLRYFIYNN